MAWGPSLLQLVFNCTKKRSLVFGLWSLANTQGAGSRCKGEWLTTKEQRLFPNQQCQTREAELSRGIVDYVYLAGVETGF